MRVTQTVLMSQVLADLLAADGRRLQVHRQLSTGRRINAPSDDPVGAVGVLRYRTELSLIERYRANAADGRDWIAASESALQSATDILQRARELAVQGANGTLNQASLQALAAEVGQLREGLIQVGNATLGDRYLFGGQKTTAAPFDAAGNYLGGRAVGGDADLVREVGPGVTVTVNVTGDMVLEAATRPTGVLDQLATHLAAGDTAAVAADIGQVDQVLDQVFSKRAELGARQARLELADRRLQDTAYGLQQLQSEVEDVDVAEVATRLSVQENAYRVALAATARIVQPTLLDFLR